MNMTKKIELTCIIRTKNEAERIGAVIKKVKEIGAEVIIIDDCSNDQTRTIALNEGAVVIEQPWLGRGLQKKVGENASSNEWIIDLDADELLSTSLQKEIYDLFKNGPPDPGIYSLKYITIPPVPKGCIWKNSCIDRRCKMYHKKIVTMQEHSAWDQIILPKNIKPKKLNNPIYHYGFLSIHHQMDKMNKASSHRAEGASLKSKNYLILRILFGFPIYFSKKYFKQKMFLLGIYGFSCAIVISSNRWLKDVKMFEKHLVNEGTNSIHDHIDPFE